MWAYIHRAHRAAEICIPNRATNQKKNKNWPHAYTAKVYIVHTNCCVVIQHITASPRRNFYYIYICIFCVLMILISSYLTWQTRARINPTLHIVSGDWQQQKFGTQTDIRNVREWCCERVRIRILLSLDRHTDRLTVSSNIRDGFDVVVVPSFRRITKFALCAYRPIIASMGYH